MDEETHDYTDDEQLLAEIRTGDEEILKTVYHSYWSHFKEFVLQLYGMSEDEAADIYTRSFTAFYFNIKDGKLVPPLKSKLKTYLFGIGRNYIRKEFERKQKAPLELLSELQAVEALYRQPNVVDFYELEWQRQLVKKLLDQVDASCREILSLSFIQEFSDEAIRHRMEIPSENAVRQRRFNCLEKLRRLVQQNKL